MTLDVDGFLKSKYVDRTEFIEINCLYEHLKISDELRSYINDPEFQNHPKVRSAIGVFEIPELLILKQLYVLKKLPPGFPEDEVKALRAGLNIRGLTGKEWAEINGKSLEEIERAIDNLARMISGDLADSIKLLFESADLETKKRFLIFEKGVMEIPEGKRFELARKLYRDFPIDFLRVTNKISELTGMGRQLDSRKRHTEDRE